VTARIVDVIARKRDGRELSADELRAAIAPGVPNYQLAAFLMAVVWRGLTPAETNALLDAMVDSGERLDLGDVGRPVADKHSTGGVGDKTTLVAAPLAVAAGAAVAKLSGRGLGHTGGTLDKLESIPGFRVELSPAELRAQVARIGIAIAGQSPALVPADRRLYALRDVTATVQSVPLLATSIMSKKIAGGASRLVLDVKLGDGALMPDPASMRVLAEVMRRLGDDAGIATSCLLTGMDEPLGRAVGNALEVEEAAAALRGEGPADLTELALEAAGRMAGGREAAERALDSGAAYEVYERWIRAQGGDPDADLPRAPRAVAVPAPRDGVMRRCRARDVGLLAMRLGAGRRAKDDAVDHAVGVVVHRKAGDQVARGEPLATLHCRGDAPVAEALACFELAEPGEPAPARPPIVLDTIG
jgi:pyrimidine-nucleoside phosphorylase